MKICTRCVLPETFPGITYDDEGVCNICRHWDHTATHEDVDTHRRRFEARANEIRPLPGVHAILSYSGGKDSTYTLFLLRKHYGLRVHCVTVDNAFLDPAVMKNVEAVAKHLGATYAVVKPPADLLCHLFAEVEREAPFPPKSCQRASNICTACMAVVKNIVLRIALEARAPLIAYGWSPGQAPLSAAYFQMNKAMVGAMANVRTKVLDRYGGAAFDPYLLNKEELDKVDVLPCNANPLAFHPYDEATIKRTIQQFGWQPPQDTDGNSTNCRLNGFAIRTHLARYGYHPYAMEVAGLVRAGMMTREEGLKSLADLGSDKTARACATRLGFPPDYADVQACEHQAIPEIASP